MKTAVHNDRHEQGAYTVVEMMVAGSVLALLGLVFLQVLNTGLVLFTKNTAVNSAHEQAREGINRLTRDIHAAVSVPQLRSATHDTNYTVAASFAVASSAPVGGVAPMAAGVSFQNVVTGSPDFVWKDPGNDQKIMIKDNPNPPTAGMRLLVPFWGIEDDIIRVAGSTTSHSNVELATGQETELAKKAPTYVGGDAYALVYYTERLLYVVENGSYVVDSQGPYVVSNGQYVAYTSGSMQRYRYENGKLNLYRQRRTGSGSNDYFYWQLVSTVAQNLSTPTPFYVPLNTGGSPDLKYVGVKLSTRDSSSSNRGYKATAALLDTQIDYRSRIAIYQ